MSQISLSYNLQINRESRSRSPRGQTGLPLAPDVPPAKTSNLLPRLMTAREFLRRQTRPPGVSADARVYACTWGILKAVGHLRGRTRSEDRRGHPRVRYSPLADHMSRARTAAPCPTVPVPPGGTVRRISSRFAPRHLDPREAPFVRTPVIPRLRDSGEGGFD